MKKICIYDVFFIFIFIAYFWRNVAIQWCNDKNLEHEHISTPLSKVMDEVLSFCNTFLERYIKQEKLHQFIDGWKSSETFKRLQESCFAGRNMLHRLQGMSALRSISFHHVFSPENTEIWASVTNILLPLRGRSWIFYDSFWTLLDSSP